ncbi:hypothetical protein CEXT_54251 [Caerostris extrusa]|uniref:Uncharacterized protein n=1 Tax=Caerostris extrusa TaxID=172846 RepID=A0AAV4QNN7_CAEEX|nr:hypothetical protein CEXT_54251 [Caerostris extrusa]
MSTAVISPPLPGLSPHIHMRIYNAYEDRMLLGEEESKQGEVATASRQSGNCFISRKNGRHLLPQSLDEWFLGVGGRSVCPWDAFRWLLDEGGWTCEWT